MTTLRPWVILCSGSPWDAQHHRQQALARELARPGADGARVLFVDPPGLAPQPLGRVDQVGDDLWVGRVTAPVPGGRHLAAANRLNRIAAARQLRRWLDERPGRRILWIDEDLASPIVGRLGEDLVVYDATDLDWTFTRPRNRAHVRDAMTRAVAAADLVLASSGALPERLPPSRRAPVVVANGCEPEHFAPTGPVPSWVEALPHPRLGYLGAIDTRAFDAELVAAVARAHPAWQFVLVGPATSGGKAPLAGLRNIHLHPPVPHSEAPAILRGCDVGLIPYQVGGLIDYVHPKKMFEYLAVELPVVATPLPSLAELVAEGTPLVVADGPGGFGDAIAGALAAAEAPGAAADRAARRSVAMANSWSHRGAQVRALLAGATT